MEKYVSFDIETYGSVERPEGITCAATLTDAGELTVWHPKLGADGRYEPRMSTFGLCKMLAYLETQWLEYGRRPLAFNGLSFDFRVLHDQLEELPFDQARVKALALAQIDPALHFLSEKGYMVGLAAMSKGMGASGKLEGFDGHKAAELWMTGTIDDQKKILEYVAQDVVTTREVYDAILKLGLVRWVTRAGKLSSWIPSTRKILAAKEVINQGFVGRPSWWSFDYPWTKEAVTGWLDK